MNEVEAEIDKLLQMLVDPPFRGKADVVRNRAIAIRGMLRVQRAGLPPPSNVVHQEVVAAETPLKIFREALRRITATGSALTFGKPEEIAERALQKGQQLVAGTEPDTSHPLYQGLLAQEARAAIRDRLVSDMLDAKTVAELENASGNLEDYGTAALTKLHRKLWQALKASENS